MARRGGAVGSHPVLPDPALQIDAGEGVGVTPTFWRPVHGDPALPLALLLLLVGLTLMVAHGRAAARPMSPGDDAYQEALRLYRGGRFTEAAGRFRRALALEPADAEAQGFLDQVLAARGLIKESRPRPPVPEATPIEVVAGARERQLWVLDAGVPRPLFVKGINMGVALPGRFPAEFPADQETYARWLDLVSGMGANTVRLYTLLPPAFYSALAQHNREGRGRLWLVQGVWTELPEDHDYDAPPFLDGFREEIRRVVDAVHGNLDLPPRPGRAFAPSRWFRRDQRGA